MPKVGRRPHVCWLLRHESPSQPRTLRNTQPSSWPAGQKEAAEGSQGGAWLTLSVRSRHGRGAGWPLSEGAAAGRRARGAPLREAPHPDSTGGGGSGVGALGARGPPRANRGGRDHRAERSPDATLRSASLLPPSCGRQHSPCGRRARAGPGPRPPRAYLRRPHAPPARPAPQPALPLEGPQRSLRWVRDRQACRHLDNEEGVCVTYQRAGETCPRTRGQRVAMGMGRAHARWPQRGSARTGRGRAAGGGAERSA